MNNVELEMGVTSQRKETKKTSTSMIENPMKIKIQNRRNHEDEQKKEQINNQASISSKCYCCITKTRFKNMIKGGSLYLLSTIVTAFLYHLCQQVAVASAELKNHKNVFIQVRWWFEVGPYELIFYLFNLSTLTRFVINAGGGSKYKHSYLFILIGLFISTTLIVTVPNVYQHVENKNKALNIDRNGGSSMDMLEKKFEIKDYSVK